MSPDEVKRQAKRLHMRVNDLLEMKKVELPDFHDAHDKELVTSAMLAVLNTKIQ